MPWYLLAASVASIGLVAAIILLIFRRSRRRPLSRDEKLAAARAAARSIRGSSRKPGRDVFERGHGVPDRYSAAIAENAAYGDAAGFGSGGAGD